MRAAAALASCAALLAACASRPALSDVVVLKSGRTLHAEKVVEEDGRVVLVDQDGRASFSFPRSSVARIEREARPRATVPAAASPAPSPAATPAPKDAVRASAPAASAAKPAPPSSAGTASDAAALLARGTAAIEQRRFREAEETLRLASTLAPSSPDVWRALGAAQYALNLLDAALASWREAQRLEESPTVARLIEKAERERGAEDGYFEGAIPDVVLRYQGKKVSPAFRRALLDVLGSEVRSLSRTLEQSPAEPILVVLYTDQAFRDVTRAPGWSGAFYDGKVRVPVEGLEEVTPSLRAVLRHELVHAFVHQRSRGRAPTWLQEGLAQHLEGRRSRGVSRLTPLSALEGSLGALDPQGATNAYNVSLAAVEMLRQRFGFGDLGRVLDRLADGDSAEDALKAVLRLSYRDLDEELARWMASHPPRAGDVEAAR